MTHTRLVFLRHGRTEWNSHGRLQGQADIALDEVGERQALQAARFFATWPFAACYSSSMQRALKTAQVVSHPHGIEPVPEQRLHEINVGSWSGKTSAEVVQEMPHYFDHYIKGIDFRRSTTGETMAEMTARALPAVLEIAERHTGEQVLIVSHGLLLANMVQALVNPTGSHMAFSVLGNTCYSVVGMRDEHNWVITHNAPTGAD